MLTNLHTHSTFCDGKNTPEEIVLAAIERGFDSIGFSSHGHTPYDLRYCMKDTDGYIAEINRLKQMYAGKIRIYLGIEEDAFSYAQRHRFDYIIGSSHYFNIDGTYYPIDSSYDYFKKCLEAFDYDVITLATTYYQSFCAYIKERKPDIIGHFDLITKFDKVDVERFLNNDAYNKIAEQYAAEAAGSGCIFEVNTGVISRGYRDFPHPAENLLYVIRKCGGKVTVSSDSHEIKTLDFQHDIMKKMLRDIGFDHIYVMSDNGFEKHYI